MKKHIKIILILSLMLTSAMVFAQFPTDPDVTADPAAPIDGYVIGFLIVGLGLAYWKLSKALKKA